MSSFNIYQFFAKVLRKNKWNALKPTLEYIVSKNSYYRIEALSFIGTGTSIIKFLRFFVDHTNDGVNKDM